VLTRLGLPAEAPATPGPALLLRLALGVAPGRASVAAELPPRDRRVPRPRAPENDVLAGLRGSVAHEVLRDPGRHEQRARHDPLDRRALLVFGLPHPVRLKLLVAGERLVDHLDLGQPLDAGHPVPAGDDEAQRETVLRRERLAVHLVGEQQVVAERFPEREAALVALLDVAVDAPVEAGEEHLDGPLPNARLFEQRPQRGAGPARGADGLEQPGLAHGARIEAGAGAGGPPHLPRELPR